MKQVLLGVLLGVAIAVAAMGTGLAFLVTRPVPEPVPLPPTSGGDVVLNVSEPFLSAMISDLLRSEEESIRDVTVDVQPEGILDITLAAAVRLLNVPLTLRIQLLNALQLQGQQLQVSLLKINLGGLDIRLDWLPASLQRLITSWADDATRQANEGLRKANLVPVSLSTDDATITLGLRWMSP